MSFPTEEIQLGPHAYGVRKGTEGVVFHTTEGAGPSRQNALDTIRLQSPGGSLWAGGGSYHFIIYDGGVFLTVPYLESAGSLTTKRVSTVWQPDAWLSKQLSPAAMADPNAYLLAICFSGKAAELSAGKYPDNMIETAARLLIWFEKQSWAPDNAPVSGHDNWQLNRSDPGVGVVDRILERYALLVEPPPLSRVDRLHAEVRELRKQFPRQRDRWYRATDLSPSFDGPLTREQRLAAEVLYLRTFKEDVQP